MGGQGPAAGQAVTAASALRDPGFTGREREVTLLGQALDGPPSVVVVEGEAGIGKTRLIQEFLASRAGGPGGPGRAGMALVACCPPYRQPHTLGPVADALRQAAGGDIAGMRLSALAGALRPLFPEWCGLLPPAPEAAEDATAARHRLFRAVAEFLDRLRVALLVVEDVHWADEATLEFLLFLAAGQPRRVSVVVTFRPEDVTEGSLLPRLARHAAGSSGVHLTVRPLTVAETAELVSSMLDGQEVSDAFSSFLHQRTDGVPLAVEESIRLMAERADLIRRADGWARRHLEKIPVPRTIRDAVLQRMARLNDDAQAILQAAAVVASPAPESLLATVAGLGADHASSGLGEALGCSLLAEDGRGLVSFSHVLACQAVYEAVPSPRRRMLHRRAGEALEDCTQQPVVQLARHFRAAGETAKWSIYAERAADVALASGDETAAVAILCDLIAEGGNIGLNAACLLEKVSFGSVDDPDRYLDLLAALRRLLASGIGDAREEAQARLQLGRLLRLMVDYEAGHAELRQAIPQLASDPVRAAYAMTMLGWPHDTISTAQEHRRWLDRAAQAAASLGPSDQLRVLVERATAMLLLGEEEGWAEAARLPQASPVRQERQLIAAGYLNTGDLAMMWGRYPDARRCLALGETLARQHGYARPLQLIHAAQAHLDWLTGSWDGLTERAQSLSGESGGLPGARLDAALVLGLISAARGDSASAEGSLRAVAAERQRRGEIPLLMEPAGALAELHLAAGRVQDALQATQQPMTVITRKRIWLWGTDLLPVRVSALISAGETACAAELVTEFARGLGDRNAPAPHAALLLCRAILAEGRCEYGHAAGLFARAAGAWQALPRPHAALLARERQAACLLAAGSTDAALALLTKAQQGLAALGATAAADRVARTLREQGMSVHRVWRGGRRGYGDELSPRELDVVRRIAAGASVQQTAGELYRSKTTVYSQLQSAMRKLGVSSRAVLALRASELGLIPEGDPEGGLNPVAPGR